MKDREITKKIKFAFQKHWNSRKDFKLKQGKLAPNGVDRLMLRSEVVELLDHCDKIDKELKEEVLQILEDFNK